MIQEGGQNIPDGSADEMCESFTAQRVCETEVADCTDKPGEALGDGTSGAAA